MENCGYEPAGNRTNDELNLMTTPARKIATFKLIRHASAVCGGSDVRNDS